MEQKTEENTLQELFNKITRERRDAQSSRWSTLTFSRGHCSFAAAMHKGYNRLSFVFMTNRAGSLADSPESINLLQTISNMELVKSVDFVMSSRFTAWERTPKEDPKGRGRKRLTLDLAIDIITQVVEAKKQGELPGTLIVCMLNGFTLEEEPEIVLEVMCQLVEGKRAKDHNTRVERFFNKRKTKGLVSEVKMSPLSLRNLALEDLPFIEDLAAKKEAASVSASAPTDQDAKAAGTKAEEKVSSIPKHILDMLD